MSFEDTIREMVRSHHDAPLEIPPDPSKDIRLDRFLGRIWQLNGWLLLVVSVTYLVLYFSGTFEDEGDVGLFMPITSAGTAVICVGLIWFGRRLVAKSKVRQAEWELRQMSDIQFAQKMQELSLTQRVAILQIMANHDVERLRNQGLIDAAALEHLREVGKIKLSNKEAKRVREDTAVESGRDRTLSTDQLLLKHKQELKILKKTVRSSADVTAEDITAFNLYEKAIAKIEQEPDEAKREQLIRALDRKIFR